MMWAHLLLTSSGSLLAVTEEWFWPGRSLTYFCPFWTIQLIVSSWKSLRDAMYFRVAGPQFASPKVISLLNSLPVVGLTVFMITFATFPAAASRLSTVILLLAISLNACSTCRKP